MKRTTSALSQLKIRVDPVANGGIERLSGNGSSAPAGRQSIARGVSPWEPRSPSPPDPPQPWNGGSTRVRSRALAPGHCRPSRALFGVASGPRGLRPWLCACDRIESARCESLQEVLWHTLTEGNCVAVRRGREQPEVNDQSVTQVNSIRPTVAASLLFDGEAQVRTAPKGWPQQCGPVSPT